MKIKQRLLILIMAAAIACFQWMPAFAASNDSLKTEETKTVKTDVNVSAGAAIVIDAETGEILYSKDPYTPRQPASVTKIVTCMVVLEHLDLDHKIIVKSDAQQMGSIINVKAGEEFTTEQLLYALMLPSANDAAVALAEEVSGTVDEFCKLMDAYAVGCGARSTHFRNPNGLNWAGQEDHLTTAYDLAMITKKAMENKTFRKIVSTLTYEIPKTNMSKKRELVNTNKFLWTEEIKAKAEAEQAKKPEPEPVVMPPAYEGVLGVKTGLTSTAGECFVGAVDVNGTELISVVLHSGDEQRFTDTAILWDHVIDTYYDTHTLAASGESVDKIRVKRGEVRKVEAVCASDAQATVPKGEDIDDVRTEIVENELRAPVKKGDKVGVLKVYNGKELVDKTDLLAAETVKEGGFLSIFGIPDWMAPFIYITVIILAAIFIILRRMKKQAELRRQRRRRRRQNRNV